MLPLQVVELGQCLNTALQRRVSRDIPDSFALVPQGRGTSAESLQDLFAATSAHCALVAHTGSFLYFGHVAELLYA